MLCKRLNGGGGDCADFGSLFCGGCAVILVVPVVLVPEIVMVFGLPSIGETVLGTLVMMVVVSCQLW